MLERMYVDRKGVSLNSINFLLPQFKYFEIEHLRIQLPARERRHDYSCAVRIQ